ncbi:uncharacterized protein LOC128989158 [Macrosteles quadrilineatus]|uniref:uncharacterized protein LOC128989158 n=1 Tax=Macrosteles quadrilineatus TaxID=74068 RepID=UPI0023E3223F|nr:uncharacterized protein LOC128989158 [Macrosteles quadrilineatus]
MDGVVDTDKEIPPEQKNTKDERKRSKSVESRASSSSELDTDVRRGARRRSKESKITEEKSADQRISKAIEEEDAFLDYIKSLPAMSNEKVEEYNKSRYALKRSTSEASGGLEHLDNLYRLMEHLGQLRIQNSKLQERVKYLENIAHEDMPQKEHEEIEEKHRSKRSTKCKSSHYGIRQTFMKSTRERSRSVGVEELLKTTGQYRAHEFDPRSSKSKVSKWTKVKEAFRWEKASNGVLPEAKSQDSGLGTADDVRFLRVPQTFSDSSSPADSAQLMSSASTSDEDLEDAGLQECTFQREFLDTKRSKSLDGEAHMMTGELLDHSEAGKEHKSGQSGHKGMKTPWGKMKDIIQTRTGSVKKKKGDSDVEEDTKSGISAGEMHTQDALYHDSEITCDHSLEGTETDVLGRTYDKTLKRKLAPMLTITLPSTEELHSGNEPESVASTATKVSTKPPPSPQTDERHLKTSVKGRPEEGGLRDKSDHVPRKISGGSAGTSPPTPRRLSKWSKVKNAFLTSGAQSEDCLLRGSSSVPSSPVKSANFTYDIESDELSSGEFMDDSTRDDDVFPDASEEVGEAYMKHDNIQAEIQRNYEELQLKLSQEFHKKLCEWERMKSSGSPGTPPCSTRVGGSGFSSGTSSVGDDSPHDKGFRKKMEEWEKMKSPSTSKHRESVTLQQLGEENLSPDFKKKLEEWEKIKSTQVPQTPDIVNISQPQFKKKITEWQLWRPGVVSSKSDVGISSIATPPADLPDDFYKKLQEWERLKQGHIETDCAGNKTPSPASSRRDCSEHKSGKSQTSPISKKGSDFGFQLKIQKSKSHHEVKELAWLEKELHKIEREKQRLERERDKYLEREARLETLRKAIGANLKKQEILIPTSTGLFRFEGISQKFTRKLYEWEKAKGIGPEASTFALLDPGYQPPGSATSTQESSIDGMASIGSLLTRSKSMGSVVDIVAMTANQSTLTHQPSSLSLNHMEQLENNQLNCTLRNSLEMGEPQAVIVDIEDVVEETAAPLPYTPAVECQTPVYCYAPSEVTRLIDSSGSDSDRDLRFGVPTQSSIELLHENISLLDKLQRKEDICRELENKIDDVEDKLHTTERIHRQHLGTLVSDEAQEGITPEQEHNVDNIKEKLLELESQQKELLEEEVTLQHSFVEHSEQQALIAQDLVGKVKQLQDNIATGTTETDNKQPQDNSDGQPDSYSHVQELTSQLIQLAEKLEHAVGERNQEISLLRKALNSSSRAPSMQKLRLHQHWFSTDSVAAVGVPEVFPCTNSEDLTELPVILTNKLQELKSCLGSLTPTPEMNTQPVFARKKILNVISPESPEVETTFVFSIRKKSTSDGVIIGESSKSKVSEEEGNEAPPVEEQPLSLETLTKGECDVEATKNDDKDGEELKKPHVTESVVEFTYPLKTYFREDSREKRFKKKSGYVLSDSDDTDSDIDSTKKGAPSTCKPIENLESENVQENTTVKKYKRSRHNSGLLERRRSRTDSKEENSDEDEVSGTGLFDSCASKKCINYEERYRKSTVKGKSLPKETENVNNSLGNKEELSINVGMEDTAEGSIKPLHSPKCVSRRLKKSTKNPKESKNLNDSKCLTYNFCCNAESEDLVPNQEMAVNVFVPTTRKIFSPVRKDSKGEASSVISYVVEDPVPSTSLDITSINVSDNHEGIKKNNDEVKIGSENQDSIERSKCRRDSTSNKPDSEESNKEKQCDNKNKNEDKPKFDFIMPPCWIIKQVRAQSASPALQRRAIQLRSKEKVAEKENVDKLETSESKQDSKPQEQKQNVLQSKAEDLSTSRTNKPNDSALNSNTEEKADNNSLDTFSLREQCRKNSSSSESVENSRSIRKEGTIPSSLKLRSEAGFPPISPLTVRREMKVMKETAPSIRMMIAKYNQKVHESQELTGTKSPDSGGQSPVAWRSPIAERRIRSQMERYQEEVKKAFQSSSKADFYPYAALGQVQKSASAGYIRPFEKECSNDSINDRSEAKGSSQVTHGILKSSSVGAIKSMSPLPPKRNINNSDVSLQKDYSISTVLQNKTQPRPLEQNDPEKHGKGSCKNVDFEREKMKLPHIPPIPTTLLDDNTIYPLDSSPESTRLRALKIKKAKEEFLSRGCVRSKQPGQSAPSTPDTSSQSDRMPWTDSKSRLSQISCGSESSYENVPMILVSGKDQSRDQEGALLVKSASAGMINIDSAASTRVFGGSDVDNSDQGAIPKSKSGILSRFRKARLKRHKDKENAKLNTVSTLCRQSLVVDINKRNKNSDTLPSSSKSCPSSPVLHKKDQTTSGSWIRNPKRIFKPK